MKITVHRMAEVPELITVVECRGETDYNEGIAFGLLSSLMQATEGTCKFIVQVEMNAP